VAKIHRILVTAGLALCVFTAGFAIGHSDAPTHTIACQLQVIKGQSYLNNCVTNP
jgi:hypothetical protein